MKLKALWLPMIILTVIGGAIKICDTIFTLNGGEFFIDSLMCNIIFVAAMAVVLIIGAILCFADRGNKYASVPQKNTVCGVCGFIASVAIIGGAVINLINIGGSESVGFELIKFILSVFGGAVLLVESSVLFTGNNSIAKVPVVALAVPIWSCTRLMTLFISYSTVSVQSTEMLDIISVALMLMFMFYQASYFAELGKPGVIKSLAVYGMTFIMSAAVVTVDLIIKKTYSGEMTVNNILDYVCDIALCVYAVALILSVFKSAELISGEDDENKADELSSEDENSLYEIEGVKKYDISNARMRIVINDADSEDKKTDEAEITDEPSSEARPPEPAAEQSADEELQRPKQAQTSASSASGTNSDFEDIMKMLDEMSSRN